MKNNSFIPESTQQFLDFVEVPDIDPDACWEWKGRDILGSRNLVTAIGMHPAAPLKDAYRRAYELFNGPVQDGMEIRHSCSNPNCVNPDHLTLVAVVDERIQAKPAACGSRSHARKGGILQQSLLARPSLAKMRNRIAEGVRAAPKPDHRSRAFKTVKTIRAGRHQYLRFED